MQNYLVAFLPFYMRSWAGEALSTWNNEICHVLLLVFDKPIQLRTNEETRTELGQMEKAKESYGWEYKTVEADGAKDQVCLADRPFLDGSLS